MMLVLWVPTDSSQARRCHAADKAYACVPPLASLSLKVSANVHRDTLVRRVSTTALNFQILAVVRHTMIAPGVNIVIWQQKLAKSLDPCARTANLGGFSTSMPDKPSGRSVQ